MEQAVERGGDGANFACDGVAFLDLAEDLRLADDHAVERGGNAEEMANGFALAEFVEVRVERGGGHREIVSQEEAKVALVFVLSEEFNAVAGGEDDGFADTGVVGERTGCFSQAAGGDGEALAHVDGRGVVVDAEEREAHGRPANWCTLLTWFADQTASMMKKTNDDSQTARRPRRPELRRMAIMAT